MHVAAFLRDRPADAQREAAAWTTSCGALLEMPQVLGSEGSSSCCVVVSVGLLARVAVVRAAGRRHFFFSPPPSLLRHLSFVWLRHLRARARDVIRGSMTTAIATMTAIAASATGTREQSGGVAAPRDREMQCSYERRRWLRDGGRGGAGL